MKDAFSDCHPLVNFLYFGLVLLFSMFLLHPVCLGISLIGAVAYSASLKGCRALRLTLAALLPTMFLTALINPLFNHEGATILWYFPSGNPLTLQSIYYGVAAAALLCSVIAWFSCYNVVMTTDKFVYLFGRIIPALSLVLSMVLRFVPRFKAKFQQVRDAQRCVGRDFKSGKLVDRLRHAATILSIMVTWALENGVETADAMKSRGYGLPGRTAYSIYRLDGRDRRALCFLGLTGGFLLFGALCGGLSFRYFPTLKGAAATPLQYALFGDYALLCLTPFLINAWEELRWKRTQSIN